VIRQVLDQIGNGGPLLADSHIDTVEFILIVTSIEGVFLIDDGVNGDGCFAGLSIPDDQFSLSSSNWH
jgi:hypothetical protein